MYTAEIKECREKEDKHKFLYWFGNNPGLHPVPKQPPVLEISNNLVKSFTSQRSTRDVPSLVLFEQPSGCTLHLNWSTRDVPSLVLSITTQVDVPSTCTTKDVPSNVLRQRILRRLVPWIFVRGNKRYLRRLVLWNLLFKGKGRIKRFLRLCHFEFFENREGRHKRIQAVSSLFEIFVMEETKEFLGG